MALTKVPTTLIDTGAVVQSVNTQSGAVATGTTTIPNDDTIPQITEGTEFITRAITPTNSSNKLRIDVSVIVANNQASSWLTVALFQDSTAGALACASSFQPTASGAMTISFTHTMTAGTTSSTTFRVRAGGNQAGTTTFNGAAGARLFGGVLASSITVTEIAV